MLIGSIVPGRRRYGVVRPFRRLSLIAAFAVVGLFATSAAASAATRNVTATGTDAGDCTASACATIGFAVGVSDPGDTIVVGPGTFGGTTINKALTLEGAKAGVDARTRSVANTNGETIWQSVIHIAASDVTIDGFSIRPSSGTPIGVKVDGPSARSNLNIINNVIAHNSYGIHASDPSSLSDVTIARNQIAKNNVGNETGIWITGVPQDNTVISDNEFAQNSGALGGNTAINLAGADDPGVKATNVQITGNTSTNDGSFLVLLSADGVTVSGNRASEEDGTTIFIAMNTHNTAIADNVIDDGAGHGIGFSNAFGGSVQSSGVSVLRNSITRMGGRPLSVGGNGFYTGPLELHGNRFVDNALELRNIDVDTTLNASNNWWGCNAGPGQSGCDTVAPDSLGTTSTPWLLLGLTATPASITVGGTSQVVADLTHNSAAETPGVGFPSGVNVAFATTLGSITSPVGTASPFATSTFSSNGTAGTATITGTLDNQSAPASVTVNATPTTPPAGGAAGQVGGNSKVKKCKKKKGKKGAVAAKKCKRHKKRHKKK